MSEATSGSKKVSSRGKLPTRRSINLVEVGEKKDVSVGVAVPALVLIIAAAVALSFLVASQLASVGRANSEVSNLRRQVEEGYTKIEEFGELTDEYAHYTYSGMTQDELSRVDRTQVIALLQRTNVTGVSLDSWSVSGNNLSLSVSAKSLAEINAMARQLETEDLVNYCSVNTASKSERSSSSGTKSSGEETVTTSSVVTANIVVYLNDSQSEEASNR